MKLSTMLLQDTIYPINRCCRCTRIIPPLYEYCQEHWEDCEREMDEESERIYATYLDEIEAHKLFWGSFDPFADE